jgi:lipopolysaccharide assembly outer membrane protein LptD (OstA)
MRAAGHVEVLWQGSAVYADAIDFNLKTHELFAEGRVTLSDRDMVLSGEKLVFNLKTQTGEMLDAYGLASPTVRYQTDRLEQTDRETLAFRRLEFSSCAQIFPRWRINGRSGRIKKDRYIELYGAVLRLKSVPVFYLPYLRYPLHKDGRASGLLFPGIGRSTLQGFFLKNAFFWAIRPNVDMTLGLDYFSILGWGASDELRYLFRRASGTARFYYFRYRPDNGVYNDTRSDYYVDAEHQQTLPFLNTRLRVNVNRQSRPGFLRLLDSSFDLLKSANFTTEAALSSSFRNLQLTVSAARRDTYYVFKDSSKIEEQAPAIALNLNQQKLGRLPGTLSLSAGFLRTRFSGESYDEDPDLVGGVWSRRLTLTPSYQLPLLRLPWLSAALQLESANVLYDQSLDPETRQVLDEPVYARSQTASFTLKGPIFSRVFGSAAGRLKHVIEPQFVVSYAGDTFNGDRVVKVNRFDYPAYSYAAFQLTTRLLARGAGSAAGASEVLAYTIGQQYYFDPAAANQNRKINGEYPAFSSLTQSLRLRLGGDFTLDATADYNHYIRGLRMLNLRAAYSRSNAPLTGSLSYSLYRNPYKGADFELNRRQAGAALRLDVPGFPLKLDSRVEYDLSAERPRLMIAALNAGVDLQCLFFNAEIRFYSWLGKRETQFQFGVSLGQLGRVSDFFGGT